MTVDVEAIKARYIENADALDASSYDVLGLCARVVELEAEVERLRAVETLCQEWEQYYRSPPTVVGLIGRLREVLGGEAAEAAGGEVEAEP